MKKKNKYPLYQLRATVSVAFRTKRELKTWLKNNAWHEGAELCVYNKKCGWWEPFYLKGWSKSYRLFDHRRYPVKF